MTANNYLSAQNSTALKGIAALAVVVSHIYTSGSFQFSNSLFAFLFGSLLGYIPVSIFFFLSGYGLLFSYCNKKNYIQTFHKTRIFPFYAFIVIFTLFYFCFIYVTTNKANWPLLIQSFIFGGTIIKYGWYLQTILLIYLLYWLSYSLPITNSKKLLVFAFFLTTFYFISCLSPLDPTYYATSPCVLLGMVWYQYRNEIDKLINNRTKKWVSITLLAITCVLIKFLTDYMDASAAYLFQLTSTSLLFTTAAILFLKGISLHNRITAFLGKISLEIYVLQGIVILLLEKFPFFQKQLPLRAALIIIASIALAALSNPLVNRLNQFLKTATR